VVHVEADRRDRAQVQGAVREDPARERGRGELGSDGTSHGGHEAIIRATERGWFARPSGCATSPKTRTCPTRTCPPPSSAWCAGERTVPAARRRSARGSPRRRGKSAKGLRGGDSG